jgi:hypothetical protein
MAPRLESRTEKCHIQNLKSSGLDLTVTALSKQIQRASLLRAVRHGGKTSSKIKRPGASSAWGAFHLDCLYPLRLDFFKMNTITIPSNLE